ncbi:WG repeat-containing protein [Prevotella sp. 10(H)]|uniref:WG repeat-containing protein n=1 Tax=Prevotella sp. 10(H) TaxID=1158294 RepID=UPI0004A73204|nr:WG repeat-containing protein [Prevotella sp. 10(H)]
MKNLLLILTIFLPTICIHSQPGASIKPEIILERELPDSIRYGTVDSLNQTVVPFIYEHLTVFNERFYAARKGQKWGLIDRRTAQESTPFIYDIFEVMPLKNRFSDNITQYGHHGILPDRYRIARKDGLQILIDSDGREVFGGRYEMPGAINDSVIIVRIDGKCGLISTEEKIVLPAVYDTICMIRGNRFAEVYKDAKKSYYDPEHNEFLSTLFYDIKANITRPQDYNFSNHIEDEIIEDKEGKKIGLDGFDYFIYSDEHNLFIGNKGFKSCLISRDKKMLTPMYDKIYFIEGYPIMIGEDNKFALANERGELVTPFFDNISNESDGIFVGRKGRVKSVFDKNGKEISPETYYEKTGLPIETDSDDKLSYFTDLSGKRLSPLYQQINRHNRNHYSMSAKRNDSFGLVTLQGKEIIPFDYVHISGFIGNVAWATAKGSDKKALMDYTGKILTPFIYEFDGNNPFMVADNIIPYCREGKYGFMSTSDGKEITPPEYDFISLYGLDFIRVTKGNKPGLLNRSLQVVVPPVYGYIFERYGDYFVVGDITRDLNIRMGVYHDGRLMMPEMYKTITVLGSNEFVVTKCINDSRKTR